MSAIYVVYTSDDFSGEPASLTPYYYVDLVEARNGVMQEAKEAGVPAIDWNGWVASGRNKYANTFTWQIQMLTNGGRDR